MPQNWICCAERDEGEYRERQGICRNMKASAELDNLFSASEYIRYENDDGRHEKAIGVWDNHSLQQKAVFFIDSRLSVLYNNRSKRNP